MKNWQENVIRNRQDYLENIKKIDWSQYETAYGNAGMDTADYINPINNIPGVAGLLTGLLSESHKEAMKATHLLWCALCHQHAFVSSAALPAFDFLLYGLKELDNELKVELLDIFLGFVVAIDKEQENNTWQGQLRQRVINERDLFESLAESDNEDVADFARVILEEM